MFHVDELQSSFWSWCYDVPDVLVVPKQQLILIILNTFYEITKYELHRRI